MTISYLSQLEPNDHPDDKDQRKKLNKIKHRKSDNDYFSELSNNF